MRVMALLTRKADAPMAATPSLSKHSAADVIVVGSGAAGLTAAVTAQLMGLDVMVLEKAPVFGGTTAVSGGGIWCPLSSTAKRAGITDTIDAARAYFKTVTGANFNPVRAEAFLRAGPEMIDFLETAADIDFYLAPDRPDYYHCEGTTTGARTLFPVGFDGRRLGKSIRQLRPPARETTFLGMMMRPASDLHHFLNVFRSLKSFGFVVWRMSLLARDYAFHGRSMELAGGNALIAHLFLAAQKAGVRLHRSISVRQLLMEDGRVVGVVADHAGKSVELTARRGVVLAAGGFPHDVERRKEQFSHAPTGHEHTSPAPAENTGDGIRMALNIGAYIPEMSDAACWAPVSKVPYPNGNVGVFPHLIDRQKPGFIAVTPDGRRFTNESHSYHEFGRGLRRKGGAYPLHCYLIGDHKTVRRYGMGFAKPSPVPLRSYLRSGYAVRANTLRELAERTGIDATTLEQTVADFNMAARAGVDPDFQRGSTPYNRYLGDKTNAPNPCLAPIVTGPFYALRLEMGELGTFAGVATDEWARVLKADGEVIGNLYAAGNDMSHVMGGNYLGGGAAIGPAMTFGFIAAQHLAAKSDE